MSANELVCLEKSKCVTASVPSFTLIWFYVRVNALHWQVTTGLVKHCDEIDLRLNQSKRSEVRLLGIKPLERQSVKLRFDIGYLPEVVFYILT